MDTQNSSQESNDTVLQSATPPAPDAKERVEQALKAALERELAKSSSSDQSSAGFGDGVGFGDS